MNFQQIMENITNIGFLIFNLGGSLAVFLFGMKLMSEGIQKAAGEKLQSILSLVTGNRVTAVLTGLILTVLIQSSSASTVMVVSFVHAGLLTLAQSIGVIMGANIGTTITGWIVSLLGFKFSLVALALPGMGIGFLFMMVKKWKLVNWGEFLFGLGLLFIGLNFLKETMPNVGSNPQAFEFIKNFTGMGFGSYLIFMVFGILLTFLVQSSSAAMTITLTLANFGWLDFPSAAAIILGENIGTTITANLSSIGASADARRAARAHSIFNIFGVIWMSFFFEPYLSLIDAILPGNMMALAQGEVLDKAMLTVHLALFHTLFNIINTLVCIFFIPQLTRLVEKLVPQKDNLPQAYSLKFLISAVQDTPELYLVKIKGELARMSELARTMYERFLKALKEKNKDISQYVEEQKAQEIYIDTMNEEISLFLATVTKENLTQASAMNISILIRIVGELETISDTSYSLMLQLQRGYRKKAHIPQESLTEMELYSGLVLKFLGFIQTHLGHRLTAEELIAMIQPDQINFESFDQRLAEIAEIV